MRPIYGRPEKFWESLAMPTATLPEIVNDCCSSCCDRSYVCTRELHGDGDDGITAVTAVVLR